MNRTQVMVPPRTPSPTGPRGAPVPPGPTMAMRARHAPHPLAGSMYEATADLMTLASQFALGAIPPPPPELRRHLAQLFSAMDARGRAAGIAPEDLTEATYAIMALFDEILVQANWPGRLDWQTQPLQYVHFHENTAGEGFFRRADVLMRQPHRAHVLLVYFMCLALGFQGRYAMGGGAGLAPVYDAIAAAVGSHLQSSETLSPNGEPPDAHRSLFQREAPIVRIALGLLGMALIAFLVLRLVMSSQVASAVQPMRDYARATAKP